MPAWKDYKGQSIGLARIMGEAPYSDGTTASLIKNWVVDEKGYLDSTYRIMSFIPFEWNNGLPALPFTNRTLGGEQRSGVLAMKYIEMDGERPEILFLTFSGVYSYAPWSRPQVAPTSGLLTSNGLKSQLYYYSGGTTSITPQNDPQFPAQMETFNNRIYFSFCDGGGLWVWDGYRIREFGYTRRPFPPMADGPQRSATFNTTSTTTDRNNGGFSHRGRIGTIDTEFLAAHSSITGNSYLVAGGVANSSYQYAVVFENTDGGYSETSLGGGKAIIEMEIAGEEEKVDRLQRRFRVHDIPQGPTGTVARILLRTYNLERLPAGSFGEYRFLHRIPNNEASEYVDDIPDGELGPEWNSRATIPIGVFFIKSFSGSLWLLRNEGNPSRVWFSEQEEGGPVAESFMQGHYMDVFPSTGPITAALDASISEQNTPVLLVFKENALHYITGQYPNWNMGTLHHKAGCAGPNLVQAMPDGSIVWYGSGTFWKMLPSGQVIDVAEGVRSRIQNINHRRSRYGVSWVDRQYKEGVFALPIDDSMTNNVQFVYDYRSEGWRIREDIKIDAALTIPEFEATLLAGTAIYTSKPVEWDIVLGSQIGNVFVYHRSYPTYPVPSRESVYTTSWQSMSGLGPKLHSSHRATQVVLTALEKSNMDATLSAYQDWDFDNVVGSEISISASHPEDDNIPYYGSAIYGTNKYRTERVYGNKVSIDIVSMSVHAIKIATQNPLALYNIDIWGPFVSGSGARTPTDDP